MAKRRQQGRRALQRKSQKYAGYGGSYLEIGRTSKKKPKTLILTNKQKTKQALMKAGLHKSGPERRRQHAAMEKAVGYKIPKLSTTVGVGGRPGKASRYTTKGTKLVVGSGGQILREEFIIKKVRKGGSGKGSSGGADRGISHISGTSAAKRSRAKSRGMKVQKETRKKKSRKK